ncbi:MAG: pilus assembly protein TadG-related protein [Planctomycetaceae bacterium]
MRNKTPARRETNKKRRGAVIVLVALLTVPLLGLVALAVDYGHLCVVRTDLQRSADAAALAAVRDLVPAADGTQDLDKVRAAVRQYATANVRNVSGFTVLDSDIEIGRYDPATIYTNFTIQNNGIFDTVRVTLRRDTTANSPVSVFFARIFGIDNANVTATATAVLQKASVLYPGSDILPFAVHEDLWNSQGMGSTWSIYGNGQILDNLGGSIPGNWGTIDIGAENNSTSELRDQILNGLRQKDLDALYNDQRIPSNESIDSNDPWFAQSDTGLSLGLKSAVQTVHGQTKLVPIYSSVWGNGNNTEFHVTGWGVVEVVDSGWNGNNNTYVTLRKAYTYDGTLRAPVDLSNTTGVITGAYTTPVLVQ